VDIARNIEKILEEYETREISIDGRNYDLYIVPELSEPDLNLFQGFLLIRAEERAEVTSIKNYLAPGSGYTPRISFVFYGDKVLIKDYRKDKHIIRSINKINKSFENKIKKTIKEPSETNFDALFDRKDIIEDFYRLFNNTRNYLAENIQGIPEEDKRIEFADNFLMQMMTLWYLQARGFFNNDKNYLITKFKELSQKRLDGSGFKNYKEFLEYFFKKIRENENEQYYEDDQVGKVVVIGPAIFIGTEEEFEIVDIPDNCFYKENFTETLINEDPGKIKGGIPVLNLFESRDWIEGDIDEYVLGALYEKLITADVRKKTGSYYTPEEITSFIAWNTIEPYLLNSMDTEHTSIDALIENADSETLKTLFNKVRDIKILDPAVGSGHFLESAIDVLVEIYHKLRNRARYIGANGFEITVTDERGEIKRIDLLDIDDEHFNLYLKFFIILSRNIYGVDINPSALKVARARFFLSMAKHFRPSGKGDEVFVRFPNVHFNLREGNSLIGYASIGKDKVDLFSFSGASRKDKKYIENKIDILDDLREYLESCSEALGLEGDINSDIEDLNTIFSQKKIKWTDIERLLKIKEKLVSILIVSLNSKQATAINDLLDTIDDVFCSKFDEKFAEDYDTPLEKLKELKAFHWILDFPEAFIKGNGFDIVIGNPPYKGEKGNKDLFGIIERINPDIWEGRSNLAYIFVMRSLRNLLQRGGYLSFIIPRYWLTADYAKKFRKSIFIENTLLRIIDFEDLNPFHIRIGVNFSIILMKKERPTPYELLSVYYPKKNQKAQYSYNMIELTDNGMKFPDSISSFMENTSKKLVEQGFTVNQGIITGADREGRSKTSKGIFVLQEEIDDRLLEKIMNSNEKCLLKRWFKNSEIKRYHLELNEKRYVIYLENEIREEEFPIIMEHLSNYKDRLQERREFKNGKRTWYLLHRPRDKSIFESPKIVCPQRATINSFSLVEFPFYGSADIYFITSNKNRNNDLKLLLLVLNSKLMFYYLKRRGKLKGKQIELYYTPLKNLPIRMPNNKLSSIVDYLIFLYSIEGQNEELKDIINFLDNQIANSLVYELYFKEKFYKDGLYNEPKEYLQQTVSKHLKPINHVLWDKIQLQKKDSTKKELKEIEKENIEIIKNVYNSLKKDRTIQEMIKKIRSHVWIKRIEMEK